MFQLGGSSRLALLVALCACLVASNATAQTVTGTITGTVVDATGAVVASAKVTATNEGTGAERSLTTTDNGEFIIVSLPPATYSVKIERTGFRPITRTGLTLLSNDRMALGNVEITIGQTSEAIEVSAQAAAINTEGAEISNTISASQLNDLLIRGREPMNLVKLLPGVAQTGGGDVIGGVFGTPSPQIGGIRNIYNNLTLDGIRGDDANSTGFMSSGITSDMLGEVTILASTYVAETGPNPGASIRMVTKSGTRDFHGSLYYYKRHRQFNANDFFVNRQGIQPFPYRLTTAGFTVGGPVYIPRLFNRDRNKLFFFYNTEITRSVQPAGQTSSAAPAVLQYTTPTALERAGNFSQSLDTNGKLLVIKDPTTGLPFQNNIIPSNRINANGQRLISVFPLPNVTDRALTGGLYNYQFTNFQDAPKQSHLLKVDYLPTSKDTIMFRGKLYYSDTKSYTGIFSLNGTPLTFYDYFINHDDLVVGWTHIFSPTIVNEYVGSFIGTKESGLPRGDRNYSKVQRSTYGITLGQLSPGANPDDILPTMTFIGLSLPVTFATDQRAPIQASDELIETADNLSVNLGSHALKFGAYFHRIWMNEGQRANNFNGNIAFDNNQSNPGNTGNPFATAMLGNFSSYTESSGRALSNSADNVTEFYAQDQWKTTKRLTLTYGARFSYFSWYHLQDNHGRGINDDTIQNGSMLVLPNYNPAQTPKQYLPATVGGVRVSVDPTTGATGPAYRIGAFVPGTGNPANGTVTNADIVAGKYPRGWADHAPLQVSPRFGFAYDVFGTGKTAVRGGFGLGRHVLSSAGVSNQFAFWQPYLVTSQQFNGNLDTLLSTKGLVFPSAMAGFDRNLKVPVIYNWSIGVQQSLPAKFVVDVSYVGNTNRHVENTTDLNTLGPGARFAPQNIDPTTGVAYPDNLLRAYREYTTVTYLANESSSNYHSLQVALNRRLSSTLQLGMAYTFSRSYGIENGTCGANFGTCPINPWVSSNIWEGGLQNFDQTHVMVANFQWHLPKASKLLPNPVVRGVLDNWELSGVWTLASGFPLSVTATSSALPDISGSNLVARPNVVSSVDADSGPKTFAQYFNTAAFAMPAKGTFGNSGPNNFRGARMNNWDLTLMKNIQLGKNEKRILRLRFEGYNAFNHTQFNAWNTAARYDANGNQINSQFGQATGAFKPRIIQLGATLYF